jgi:hypothetical protein
MVRRRIPPPFPKTGTPKPYWTNPARSPKDKPFVERLINTLQREYLDYHYDPMNNSELREVVDSWLDKYRFYRNCRKTS